jgi:hypothetical protein
MGPVGAPTWWIGNPFMLRLPNMGMVPVKFKYDESAYPLLTASVVKTGVFRIDKVDVVGITNVEFVFNDPPASGR